MLENANSFFSVIGFSNECTCSSDELYCSKLRKIKIFEKLGPSFFHKYLLGKDIIYVTDGK